ncbi:MAG: thioredoxin family protein [Kiritimatiellales bacterium]|nr:thioredoxin family protein [Kiritimatiellales bacterium]
MREISIAALLFCFAVGVQARVWTNAEGKTVEAELQRVKDDIVFLKIARTRKIHPFEIDKLSEADQEYIAQHLRNMEERLKAQRLKERSSRWLTDYEKVQAEAKEYDLPILLLYTAPAWCGYCVILEDNILNKSEFRDYAKGNLVLFMADFSKKSDGEHWAKKYPELKKGFPCSGYPCAFLISPDGKNLGRIGGCDKEWTPEVYIEKLEGFRNAPLRESPKKGKKKRKKK